MPNSGSEKMRQINTFFLGKHKTEERKNETIFWVLMINMDFLQRVVGSLIQKSNGMHWIDKMLWIPFFVVVLNIYFSFFYFENFCDSFYRYRRCRWHTFFILYNVTVSILFSNKIVYHRCKMLTLSFQSNNKIKFSNFDNSSEKCTFFPTKK